jgi:outer membrane lipoprotein-sorting protein
VKWLALFFAACAPAPRAAPGSASAHAFLTAIANDEASRHAMSGEGTVTLSQKGVPLKGELTAAARDDGRVRLDVSAPGGQVMFLLVADAATLTLLDFKNRQAQREPVAGTSLAGVGLEGFTASALAALLLARLPCANGRAVTAENTINVRGCLGDDLTATYAPRHNASGFYLTRVVIHGKNGDAQATLQAHTAAGLPRRIEIETSAGRAIVALSDVDVNPALADGLFSVDIPPGLGPQK